MENSNSIVQGSRLKKRRIIGGFTAAGGFITLLAIFDPSLRQLPIILQVFDFLFFGVFGVLGGWGLWQGIRLGYKLAIISWSYLIFLGFLEFAVLYVFIRTNLGSEANDLFIKIVPTIEFWSQMIRSEAGLAFFLNIPITLIGFVIIYLLVRDTKRFKDTSGTNLLEEFRTILYSFPSAILKSWHSIIAISKSWHRIIAILYWVVAVFLTISISTTLFDQTLATADKTISSGALAVFFILALLTGMGLWRRKWWGYALGIFTNLPLSFLIILTLLLGEETWRTVYIVSAVIAFLTLLFLFILAYRLFKKLL